MVIPINIHLHIGATPLALDDTVAFTRTFAFHGPEELSGSPSFLSDSLHPQFTPPCSLLLRFGDRDFAFRAPNHSGFQLPIPDVPRYETHDLATSQLRFPRVQVTSLRLPRSESPIPEYRYLASRELATYETNFLPFNSRDPTSRDLRNTCSSESRCFHGNWNSLPAHSTCMQLLHSSTPICRCAIATRFHLHSQVNSFPGVQVVDSLLLEESFTPNLLPFGLHLDLFLKTS
jgi:hypothetical protein